MPRWDLDEQGRALLHLSRLRATVDPGRAAAGIGGILVDGQPLPRLGLLGAELPGSESTNEAAVVDCYTRGADLIATYTDRPSGDTRTQLYWRAARHKAAGAIAAIELLASVQTSLLASRPKLIARSQLTTNAAFRLANPAGGKFASLALPPVNGEQELPAEPPCYLFRLPGEQFSYAEMVHPDDHCRSLWTCKPAGDAFLQLQHELFARPLEKGVILRARVLGVLLDRQDDQLAAAAHWRAFLSEAVPLTT